MMICGLQVKWPDGKTHEDIFVETLLKFGYGGKYLSKEWKEKPLFIQSFAPTSLIQTSRLTDSPLILLLDDAASVTQDTNQVRRSLWQFFCLLSNMCVDKFQETSAKGSVLTVIYFSFRPTLRSRRMYT
jgi:hypothetical protein